MLSIGVGAYLQAPRLLFAAADARDLAAALAAQAAADGAPGNAGAQATAPLRLYRQADARVLTDGEATLPAIREALRWFAADVPPDATLVLFLSGHGVKEADQFYFAPVGLEPHNMATTGLPWKEVLEQLQAARRQARWVWVLADCCRAAPGLAHEQQATGADLRRGVEANGNLVICTAASGDTCSYESEDLGHGLFTQAWLEALRGDAPDLLYQETPHGRVLALAGLQRIVDTSVLRHAREAGVRQKVEFPRLEGHLSLSEPLFVPVPR